MTKSESLPSAHCVLSLISRGAENISCKSVLVTHVAVLTVKKHKYKKVVSVLSSLTGSGLISGSV